MTTEGQTEMRLLQNADFLSFFYLLKVNYEYSDESVFKTELMYC